MFVVQAYGQISDARRYSADSKPADINRQRAIFNLPPIPRLALNALVRVDTDANVPEWRTQFVLQAVDGINVTDRSAMNDRLCMGSDLCLQVCLNLLI